MICISTTADFATSIKRQHRLGIQHDKKKWSCGFSQAQNDSKRLPREKIRSLTSFDKRQIRLLSFAFSFA